MRLVLTLVIVVSLVFSGCLGTFTVIKYELDKDTNEGTGIWLEKSFGGFVNVTSGPVWIESDAFGGKTIVYTFYVEGGMWIESDAFGGKIDV